MKIIKILLIIGLVGCGDGDMDITLPAPVLDASFCSVAPSTDCDAWPQQTSDAGVTAQGITYNALGVDSLMFNALLRNPRANQLLTTYSLEWLLGGSGPGSELDRQYFQTQLKDPFARRMMGYLVGCALADGVVVQGMDPVTQEEVTWSGDLGLCPSWQAIPMSSMCQELVSACMLARNNAYQEEVLISVRGVGEAVNPPAVLPLAMETEVRGGEPCESGVLSFETECLPGTKTAASNCKGWRSQHIGTCTAGQTVTVTANLAGCVDNLLLRVCNGIYGCDHSSPPHVVSTEIACQTGAAPGTGTGEVMFECPVNEVFTVMYAGEGSDTWTGTLKVTAPNAKYPAPEEEVFWWQEGAFYGNMFCGKELYSVCQAGIARIVDFRWWVEVIDDPRDPASFTVVYHQHHNNGTKELFLLFTSPTTEDALEERAERHQLFLTQGYYDPGEDSPVYMSMYACMSPEWNATDAMAKKRLCAEKGNARYCAAHGTGRCWSAKNTACQCSEDDETLMSGDMDYDNCSATGRPWQHPLTVFLNDPCDTVPESEFAEPEEGLCQGVALCRQTLPPRQSQPPPVIPK